MSDITTAAAIALYRRTQYLRGALEKAEDRLHAAVARLSPDQFTEYADATIALDRQRDLNERRAEAYATRP
jgi:hypothetical protein